MLITFMGRHIELVFHKIDVKIEIVFHYITILILNNEYHCNK